ncbi:MAG: hypothetical protein R6V03_08135, partial [Kiritimatiellia bacterium]
ILFAGQPTFNSFLAVTDDFAVGSAHLKCPLSLVFVVFNIFTLTNTGGHFEFLVILSLIKSRLYRG